MSLYITHYFDGTDTISESDGVNLVVRACYDVYIVHGYDQKLNSFFYTREQLVLTPGMEPSSKPVVDLLGRQKTIPSIWV